MTTVVDLPESPRADADPMAEINRKLDILTQNVAALGEQVQFLSEKAYQDRMRQREWDELREDMTPIINDVYDITVEQLEEIQHYVQLEDVLALLKRLARNTRTFNEMLDQVESMYDLSKDMAPLTREMMDQTVLTLNELDEKGYFGFMRQGRYVMDQVVTSFGEDDVRQLGDNVVLILNTVKSLTQPEMMTLIGNLTQGFQEAEQEAEHMDIGWLALMNQLRNPEVRRGLAITLNTLQRVSMLQDQQQQQVSQLDKSS